MIRRPVITASVILFFFITAAITAVSVIATTNRAEPSPKLEIPLATVDFGIVEPNQAYPFEVEIRNIGNAPLTVNAAIPSCGCTVASIDKSILEPGEETLLHGVFDSTGFLRQVHKNITLVTDDPQTPAAKIFLKSYVRAGLRIHPTNIFLGSEGSGSKLTGSFEVICDPSEMDLNIKYQADDPKIKFDQGDWVQEKGMLRATTRITIDPLTDRPGLYTSTFSARLNDSYIVTREIKYQVDPHIVATPKSISMNSDQSSASTTITWRSDSNRPRRFKTIESLYKHCEIEIAPKKDGSVELSIKNPKLSEAKLDIIKVTYEWEGRDGLIHQDDIAVPVTIQVN